MTYTPRVNDRVKWRDDEGWVYCITDQYFTLEVSTKPMSQETAQHTKHRQHHCLLVVPINQYNNVQYLGHRQSQYDDTITQTIQTNK